jgi:hypothetical protein
MSARYPESLDLAGTNNITKIQPTHESLKIVDSSLLSLEIRKMLLNYDLKLIEVFFEANS